MSTGCCSAAMPRWNRMTPSGPRTFPPPTSSFCEAAGSITNQRATFRPRQLPRRVAAEGPTWRNAALGIAQSSPAGPALLRQNGHRRPHVTEKRRNPRPRLSQVYRHLVLRRWLANGVGHPKRPSVAGGQERIHPKDGVNELFGENMQKTAPAPRQILDAQAISLVESVLMSRSCGRVVFLRSADEGVS